jgi:hypothetical protein
MPGRSSRPVLISHSLRFELLEPVPVLVRAAFRASFSLPQRVSALTQMLLKCALPVFFRAPILAAAFFPKAISVLANFLFQPDLRFRSAIQIVPVGGHLAASCNVNPRLQSSELSIGNQLPTSGSRQPLRQKISFSGFIAYLPERNRVGVNHRSAAV